MRPSGIHFSTASLAGYSTKTAKTKSTKGLIAIAMKVSMRLFYG